MRLSPLSLLMSLLFFSGCSSDNDKVVPENSFLILPEELKGQWLDENRNWGFRLNEPGVIEFIGLDTETGHLIEYLTKTDSIFFLDSARCLFRPSNCIDFSVLAPYVPVDTGNYHLDNETLTIELFENFSLGKIPITFTKQDDLKFPEEASYLEATIEMDTGSFQFQNGKLFRSNLSYTYDAEFGNLIIKSRSSGLACILPPESGFFNIILGIDPYDGVGRYPLYEYSEDGPRYYHQSAIEYSQSDVIYGYYLSGDLEIIEDSESLLKGVFSASFYLNEDSTEFGFVKDGYFEIHK